MFKVRKIKFYLDQMRDLNVNTDSFSIIDLIESPVHELSDIFESLTDEQKKLCWNIRKKERSCSTLDDNHEDQLLPPDHPSEIEYQFLKETFAAKMKEYEINLKISREGQEKLKHFKARVEHLEKLEKMKNNQQTSTT